MFSLYFKVWLCNSSDRVVKEAFWNYPKSIWIWGFLPLTHYLTDNFEKLKIPNYKKYEMNKERKCYVVDLFFLRVG